MVNLLKSGLAICAVLLLFGSTVSAQDRAKACVDDIKKFCGSVEPGQGRVAACVKQHLNELSPPCQNLVAGAAAAAKACAADLKKQCADARRRVAKVACIKSALANLGDECKSAISQVAAGRK
jgi:cysteine rich repeat protein